MFIRKKKKKKNRYYRIEDHAVLSLFNKIEHRNAINSRETKIPFLLMLSSNIQMNKQFVGYVILFLPLTAGLE